MGHWLCWASGPLSRGSPTCMLILMPRVLLSALLHRSWRVHKSTVFVIWVCHELQPLQMSSWIRLCCSPLCMSQTVWSHCSCLCLRGRAHVTFWLKCSYGVQNRMSRCSSFSRLRCNHEWSSIRTIYGPQSEGHLEEYLYSHREHVFFSPQNKLRMWSNHFPGLYDNIPVFSLAGSLPFQWRTWLDLDQCTQHLQVRCTT